MTQYRDIYRYLFYPDQRAGLHLINITRTSPKSNSSNPNATVSPRQALEQEQESLKASHQEALDHLTFEHQGIAASQQMELRQKLLYEYSKQDKLEIRLKELQHTLNR